MIPLRIYLKGFMSYRDETVFMFDGSPLWVLTGRNGAGKSAVFDAITFTLFGIHRGDNRTAKPLINHNSPTLSVEFDFAVGSDVYRVVRTVPRRGEATCLASHIQGPNAPYPNKKSPQPIANTDNDAGLIAWVTHILGVNHKTFTASVLLRQGRSEEILDATPQQRHDILSEMVDLSAYKRLEQKVKAKLDKHYGDASAYQEQLTKLPFIDEAEIVNLGSQSVAVTQEIKSCQVQSDRLIELRVHAQTWARLSTQQSQIEQKLNGTQQLLNQGDQIIAQKARLDELRIVVRILERMLRAQQLLSDCQNKIPALQNTITNQIKERDFLEQKLAQSKGVQSGQLILQQKQQEVRNDAVLVLRGLEPDYHSLKELDRLLDKVSEISHKLATLPEDIDGRIERGQAMMESLYVLNSALPYLHQFSQMRAQWRDAVSKKADYETQLNGLSAQLDKVKVERENAESQQNKLNNVKGRLSQLVTEAQTSFNQINASLERFHEVADMPTCHYCGQPLTADHIESERIRLNTEREAAEATLNTAHQDYSNISSQLNALNQSLSALIEDERVLSSQKQLLERDILHTQRSQSEAETRIIQPLAALPQEYRQKISMSDSVTVCFDVDYPTVAELDELKKKKEQIHKLKERLEQRFQEKKQRDDLLVEQNSWDKRIKELESVYPTNKRQAIHNSKESAEIAIQDADAQLVILDQSIKSVKQTVEDAQKQLEQANAKFQDAQQRLIEEKARETELQRSVESIKDELPFEWQCITDPFTDTELQKWQGEEKLLSHVGALFSKLIDARSQHNAYQEQLCSVQNELANIPDDAKHSLSELNEQLDRFQQRKQVLERQQRETEAKKSDLEQRKVQKDSLEQSRLEATKQAQLYKELASLLGRDALQRHLLQQVEAAIVHNANDVLDRISGGNLRLELRESASNTGSAKALDIVAYNSQIGDKPTPILVAYLSGSQRFRVAVSLALGIGRYASQGTNQIESVIIDEGFGGLDREGRDQMIEELHELKNSLNKIILVSHQEEIAHAFRENGYEIRLENGSSKVSRL